MKKTFAVVLAAMMLIAAFAGCAKKTEEPATSPVVSTTNPEAPTKATASPEAPATSETSETSEVPAAVSATPVA